MRTPPGVVTVLSSKLSIQMLSFRLPVRAAIAKRLATALVAGPNDVIGTMR